MELRVFGSNVRGEQDDLSDLDILCTTEHPLDFAERNLRLSDLTAHVRIHSTDYNIDPSRLSVSWYSRRRLREMHDSGHLFSWHLFKESIKIPSSATSDYIEELGPPANYKASLVDIRNFLDILHEGRASLRASPRNATFEAGMTYLCARNIAMCASWHSAHGLRFGRLSPYEISDFPPFPLTPKAYRTLMLARLGVARNGVCPTASADDVALAQTLVVEWAGNVVETISKSTQ